MNPISEMKLDEFQSNAIEYIQKNENVIVAAPTSSGKTICAIYGIHHHLDQSPQKKIIYTSPIKSLSNQKYYEFRHTFAGKATVGLITGDIKYNLQGNILIMTAEILRNLLYSTKTKTNLTIDIDIDIYTDVSCVIMDEAHYLYDKDRGNVWEETLMLLPSSVNLILLSATLKNGQYVANWLSNIKELPCHFVERKDRLIPLFHYLFHHFSEPSLVESYAGEWNFIQFHTNKCVMLYGPASFQENFYLNIKKINHQYRGPSMISSVKSLCTELLQNQMLPALFFVFSKKQCEYLCNNLHFPFLNDLPQQNQVCNFVRNQMQKLKNRELFINTLEYVDLVRLWSYGVAYHHSGLQTIYKEMIEMLLNKGLIKILFATETFAVGINAPIKTVVFTSLQKIDGNGQFRWIKPCEYLQMAGRAGRRGIDDKGHVVLLTNTMRVLPTVYELQNIVCGDHQNEDIHSKFRFTYQLVLKIMMDKGLNFETFIEKTFKSQQLQQEYQNISKHVVHCEVQMEKYEKYCQLIHRIQNHKKLCKNEQKYVDKIESNPNFYREFAVYQNITQQQQQLQKLQQDTAKHFQYQPIVSFLQTHNFMDENHILTVKGLIAANINEVNELLLSECIFNDIFGPLETAAEIAAALSIFLNSASAINQQYHIDHDENAPHQIELLGIPTTLKQVIVQIIDIAELLQDAEFRTNLPVSVNTNWILNFDNIEAVYVWASNNSITDLQFSLNVYMGNFVKDMLRLDNLITNVENICKIINDKYDLLEKCHSLHGVLIRDIISNESLYLH